MTDYKGKWKIFFPSNKVPLVKEAYFHYLKLKECQVLYYLSVCLGAVGRTSHSGWEKRSLIFFLTFRILPVTHPVVQMCCPHLRTHHLHHLHHPHLLPHFPKRKGKKSHWNSGRSSNHWTTNHLLSRDWDYKAVQVLRMQTVKQRSLAPTKNGCVTDLIPGVSPLGYCQQMQKPVSSYEQKYFSAFFSSYWPFSGHKLNYYDHQVASRFFYFSSFHNSVLNDQKEGKKYLHYCCVPQNHRIQLAQQKMDVTTFVI